MIRPVHDFVRLSWSFKNLSAQLLAGKEPASVDDGLEDTAVTVHLRNGTPILCPNRQNPINNRRRLVRDLMPR